MEKNKFDYNASKMFNPLHIFQNKLQYLREMLLVSILFFWLFIICIVVISVNLVANIYRNKKIVFLQNAFCELHTIYRYFCANVYLKNMQKKYMLRYIYKKDNKILLIHNIITTINHIKNDKKIICEWLYLCCSTSNSCLSVYVVINVIRKRNTKQWHTI